MDRRLLLLSIAIAVGAGVVVLLVLGNRQPRSANSDSALQVLSSQVAFPKQVGDQILFFNIALQRFQAFSTTGIQDVLITTARPTAVAYDSTNNAIAMQVVPTAATTAHWEIRNLHSGDLIATLNPNIRSLSFSPDGKRLLYEYHDETVHNLSISDIDGSNWTMLTPVSDSIADIHWLPTSTFALYLTAASPPVYHLIGLSSRNNIELGTGDLGARINPSGTAISYDSRSASTIDTTIGIIGSNGLEQTITLATHTPGSWVTWNGDRAYALAAEDRGITLIAIDSRTIERQTILDAEAVEEKMFPATTTGIDSLTEVVGIIDQTLVYLLDTKLVAISL